MAKQTKARKALAGQFERGKPYPADEALELVKKLAPAKFTESVDVAVNLGVDPKKSDQVVRGSTVLPHGTGKSVRVAVFAQGANAQAAEEAGADIVGMEDLAERIQGGDLNFDVVIASPDAMRVVGKLGQILGPRGLMPNPKVGTVSPDVAGAVRNAKAGQVRYRTDKAGPLSDRQRRVRRPGAEGQSRRDSGRFEQGETCVGERCLYATGGRVVDDGPGAARRSFDDRGDWELISESPFDQFFLVCRGTGRRAAGCGPHRRPQARSREERLMALAPPAQMVLPDLGFVRRGTPSCRDRRNARDERRGACVASTGGSECR